MKLTSRCWFCKWPLLTCLFPPEIRGAFWNYETDLTIPSCHSRGACGGAVNPRTEKQHALPPPLWERPGLLLVALESGNMDPASRGHWSLRGHVPVEVSHSSRIWAPRSEISRSDFMRTNPAAMLNDFQTTGTGIWKHLKSAFKTCFSLFHYRAMFIAVFWVRG